MAALDGCSGWQLWMAALVLDARPGSRLDGLGVVPSGIEATTNQTLQGTDSPPAEAKAGGS